MDRFNRHSYQPLAPVSAALPPSSSQEMLAVSSAPSPADGVNIMGSGRIDKRSIVLGFATAALFFGLGALCIEIARFDADLASIWLPAAACVVLLLKVRPNNHVPFYLGVLVGCLSLNIFAQNSGWTALVYTTGNLVEVGVVAWLVRRSCGAKPDMANVSHLGLFLLFGGVVGPALSTMLITLGGFVSGKAGLEHAVPWFLVHSMGMILIVPAALLALDALENRAMLNWKRLAERGALMIGGIALTYGVFAQDHYSLLFLIPPATLLMAFRVGSLGTALYVPAIMIVASYLTIQGSGPVFASTDSGAESLYLLQAFFAANYLAGLPIAAILSGRERLIAQLAMRQEELSLLTDNVLDAVFSMDRSKICTYASPSVRDVLNLEPAQLVGMSVPSMVRPDTVDQINAMLDRLLSGKTNKERLTYRRFKDAEDGSPVFIEADGAAVFDHLTGERTGVVMSARDVTERVELEVLLTRARQKAEDAAQAKTEFLTNMSHEIRTPMNGVLGFAELMLQGDLDEENRRHTEMIVQSGRSMMLLLNDILDLSKIEAEQISIDKAPLDLIATIDECAVLHRPVAERKGVELRFQATVADADGTVRCCDVMEPDGPRPWIVTDALRLRQIVLNLIGNAVKFTEKGRVEVSCDVSQESFAITIADTGIGISQSRIASIFAPFTQGETDTARRFGGTGLGLSISRHLAELLGGTIDVESEAGIGSTFRLTLPAERASAEVQLPAPEPLLDPPELPQSSRILLVEDHDVNRILGVEMLERCGQNVSVAHDGNEAIAMVIDSVMRGKPFDLILMDIQMPGCDGYDATKAIREEGITPETMPIIALTANAFPEDIKAAHDAGMQSHLAKPLVFAELAQALQRWLPTRIVETNHDEGDGAAIRLSDHRDRTDRHTQSASDAPPNPAPQPARDKGHAPPPQRHSPALLRRWNQRRSEAIEAVRGALEDGSLSNALASSEAGADLARLVHKLAGTAAIFGEPELGDKAAAFERALRQGLPGDVCEALAFELLSVADDPVDTLAQASA